MLSQTQTSDHIFKVCIFRILLFTILSKISELPRDARIEHKGERIEG